MESQFSQCCEGIKCRRIRRDRLTSKVAGSGLIDPQMLKTPNAELKKYGSDSKTDMRWSSPRSRQSWITFRRSPLGTIANYSSWVTFSPRLSRVRRTRNTLHFCPTLIHLPVSIRFQQTSVQYSGKMDFTCIQIQTWTRCILSPVFILRRLCQRHE